MMEAAAATPTRKQQQVLDYLRNGKTPAHIAKRMGISTNGVYGHMRKLRKMGLLNNSTPAAVAETNGGAAASNGHSDIPVLDLLRDAQSEAAKRIDHLNRVIEEAEQEKSAIAMLLDHPDTPEGLKG
jgi:DNA-binding CsgD family transcriptional regulator